MDEVKCVATAIADIDQESAIASSLLETAPQILLPKRLDWLQHRNQNC